MGECWAASDGYSLVWISYRPKPQCCSAKRNQLFKLRTSTTFINIVWAQSSWSTTKNYTLQGAEDGSVGDRPPAITRESWSPPPPHEGPDLTHDWLEGHAETVGTFSWVVPLQPLPRLPPCPFRRPFLCLSPSSLFYPSLLMDSAVFSLGTKMSKPSEPRAVQIGSTDSLSGSRKCWYLDTHATTLAPGYKDFVSME